MRGFMKLSDWAKSQGLNYQTAYRWYKSGRLPADAYQAKTGTIIVSDHDIDQGEKDMRLTTNSAYSKKEDVRLAANAAIKKDLADLFSYYPFGNGLFDSLYKKDQQKFKWFNKPDKYVLGCILPGYSESDVKINVKGDILSISVKAENIDEDNLFLMESNSEFDYSWTLPSDAALSEIVADYKNGILYLTVPKLQAKAKQEIQIPINKK